MIQVGKDRVIEFNKELREKRNQVKQAVQNGTPFSDYNINDYELIPFDFETGRRRVYKNFNLSIFLNTECNADCRFCIAQIRYQHKNAFYQKEHIDSSDRYLARLEEVLKMIRPLNPSISITGGEPTLSPILPDVCKIVDDLGFRKRCITTNGSQLLKTQNNSTVLENLMKYHWNHLNISRAAIEDSMNKEIMKYNIEKEYCTVEMLRDILKMTNNSEYCKHRLSCVLLKESVSNVELMKKYIDFFAENCNANNFIFRELMDYDKRAINTEKMAYCDRNKIKLYDIWHDFEKYPEFESYLNIIGYYYYVEIYKMYNESITVASETADLNIQDMEKQKNPDVVYEMVFHPNGCLSSGWVDNIQSEVLSEYKA